MKKGLFLLMMVTVLFTTSCADSLTVDGKTYEPYGFVNEDEFKDPNVVYKVHIPNLIGAVVFFQTIGFPIYVVGWEFYEPVRLKEVQTETKL
jgi:hypothetical protein